MSQDTPPLDELRRLGRGHYLIKPRDLEKLLRLAFFGGVVVGLVLTAAVRALWPTGER